MIEMLGVLAVIGVLSFGALSMYRAAIMRYRLGQTQQWFEHVRLITAEACENKHKIGCGTGQSSSEAYQKRADYVCLMGGKHVCPKGKLKTPLKEEAVLLYQVYKEETKSQETLDDFYFWGELLKNDFDDVDKNMANAKQLFGNLQELKNLEDLSYLSEEQQEAIRQFFNNFSIEKTSELKQRFITIWGKLGIIYERYRQQLSDKGIAYEGMMYRDVIDRFQTSSLPYERVAFVGFNVLNRVETSLFSKLQEAGKALFYWDYDPAYTESSLPHAQHEAVSQRFG